MISSRLLLLPLFLIGLLYQLRAQDDRDFETWTSAEFRYRPDKNWRLGLEAQLRLENNSSEVDGYFTELSGYYGSDSGFRFGLGLRFIRKNDNRGAVQGYENHLRVHLDAGFKHEIERLELSYRLRYQNRDELGVVNEEGDFADHYLRFKLGTAYDFKKWKLDPQLSAEIFHHPVEGEEEGFNKFRVTLGTEYKFKKAGRLGLFYRYEREINTAYPRSTDILRIKYVYTLKNY